MLKILEDYNSNRGSSEQFLEDYIGWLGSSEQFLKNYYVICVVNLHPLCPLYIVVLSTSTPPSSRPRPLYIKTPDFITRHQIEQAAYAPEDVLRKRQRPSDSDRVRDNDRDRDKVIDTNWSTQRDNHTDNKRIKLWCGVLRSSNYST